MASHLDLARASHSNTAAMKSAEAQSADAKRKFHEVNKMKDEEIANLKRDLAGVYSVHIYVQW